MTTPSVTSEDQARRRLGRALLFLWQQAPHIVEPVILADIDTLLLAGQAMDLAVRLKGQTRTGHAAMVKEFARHSGIGERRLMSEVLPALAAADIIKVTTETDGYLTFLEEYVGVTGSVVTQAFRLLDHLGPSGHEIALLHSIEIGSWAPLTRTQHLDQIARQTGVGDEATDRGLTYALAMGINKRIHSAELGEDVVFNPNVWGTGQLEIAAFLKGLPSAERDALVGICEAVAAKPGMILDNVGGDGRLVTSARKIGLIQAATVTSTGQGKPVSLTYVFSPLFQTEDDQATTSEALHLRKLFVAHILFGREKAARGYGRITDPVRLVSKLLDNHRVGPATNIGTDYHLLEAAGVVRVENGTGDRPFLKLIKADIVRDGLDWLRASLGNTPGRASGDQLRFERAPSGFTTPEHDRTNLGDTDAADEITGSALLKLREETQRAVRHDSPFGR